MKHRTSAGISRALIRSSIAASEVAECSYRPRLPLQTRPTPKRSCLRASSVWSHTSPQQTPLDPSILQQLSPDALPTTSHPQHLASALASVRTGMHVPSNILLDLLTSKDKDYYRKLRSQLPPDFHRLDAYLMLRSQDPDSLRHLTELDIERLVKRAGKEGLAGALSLLLTDIIGPANTNGAGYFHVPAGSQTRYNLLRKLVVICNRGQILRDDALALHLFRLLIDDYKVLSGSDTSNTDKNSPTSGVPSSFPQGDARSLVKRILQSDSVDLLPVLQALRTHLEQRTVDYPSAREASQLIEFYLKSDTRDLAAALDVVRTLKDTQALGQDAIDLAVRDGKACLIHLKSTSDTLNSDQQSSLEDICLEITLRLISMKSLMVQHPEGGPEYLSVFQSLISSFRLDVLPDTSIFEASNTPGGVALRNFRTTLYHLLAQPDVECVRQVLALLQKCDWRLLAMLTSRSVQDICDRATAVEMTDVAVQAYLLIIKAKMRVPTSSKGRMSPHGFNLVRDGFLVNPHTFNNLLTELNSSGRTLSTSAIVRGLRILPLAPASLTQLHLRMKGAERARFVSVLAGAGMKTESFELYQHWSDVHYDPDKARFLSPAALGEIVREDVNLERQYGLLKEEQNFVASSASTLLALVRCLCRGSTRKWTDKGRRPGHKNASPEAREHVKQAKFAIEVFKRSQNPTTWTHHQLTALATACSYTRDVRGVFYALSRIGFMRYTPDAVDISIMLGGLMTDDPDRAVDMFISHSTFVDYIDLKPQELPKRVIDIPLPENESDNQVTPTDEQVTSTNEQVRSTDGQFTSTDENIIESNPLMEGTEGTGVQGNPTRATFAPMRPSARLASTLVSRAMAQGRFDLVKRLLDFAEEAGISTRLGLSAASSLLTQANLAPSAVVKVVKRLLASGWPADPVLLDSAARQLLDTQVLNLSTATSTIPSVGSDTAANKGSATPFQRLSSVQTAVYLIEVSLAAKNVVNLHTVKIALNKIATNGSRYTARKSRKNKDERRDEETEFNLPSRRIAMDPLAKYIACIDRIVYALRWASYFDTGHDYRRGLPLWKSNKNVDGGFISVDLDDLYHLVFDPKEIRNAPVKSSQKVPAGSTSADMLLSVDLAIADETVQYRPNVLPAQLYRQILETYLALGDTQGATEVASWMRDEAGKDIGHTREEVDDFVDRIKTALDDQQERGVLAPAAEGSEILGMLSGQQTTARLKPWWSYRG